MTPHEQAEIIKAWADGWKVQVKNLFTAEWQDLDSFRAFFFDHCDYRVVDDDAEKLPDTIVVTGETWDEEYCAPMKFRRHVSKKFFLEHFLPKPHKHKELIYKWADGAFVQRKVNSDDVEKWIDERIPDWNPASEYRLKPDPVVRWLWAWKEIEGNLWGISQYLTDTEAESIYPNVVIKKLEWSREEFDE